MTFNFFMDRIGPAPRDGGFRQEDHRIWCGSVVRATAVTGPYTRVGQGPILALPGEGAEAPCLFHWQGRYHLFMNDIDGTLTGERHAGAHALSADDTTWNLAASPKAYSRHITWDDGTTTIQGCLKRPFLLFMEGRPTHLFAATCDGPGGFDHCTQSWNMVLPLRH